MTLTRKAKTAWGEAMPEWIAALAAECDRTSLRRTADRLGCSPAIVSLAVGNKRAKLDFIRGRTEAVLMRSEVECPAMGTVAVEACLREQEAAFTPGNPRRVQIYKACRNGCPNFKGGGQR